MACLHFICAALHLCVRVSVDQWELVRGQVGQLVVIGRGKSWVWNGRHGRLSAFRNLDWDDFLWLDQPAPTCHGVVNGALVATVLTVAQKGAPISDT